MLFETILTLQKYVLYALAYYLKKDKLYNNSDKIPIFEALPVLYSMFMDKKNYIVFLAVCLMSFAFASRSVQASPAKHNALSGRFTSVAVGERTIIPVYALVQDTLGFVWIGTDAGLFRHDGIYGQHFGWEANSANSLCNEHINVLSYDRTAGTLYIGTDKGFCVYDNAGGFVQDAAIGPRHVKSTLVSRDGVWIGTTEGLFVHKQDTTISVMSGEHIASACQVGETKYFGSYGCVWRVGNDVIDSIDLKGQNGTSGNLVLALIEVSADFLESGEKSGDELFVGSERGLFRLDVRSGGMKSLWNGGPAKNFRYLPDGSLAVGTDNGLLLVSVDGFITVYRHELSNTGSIPDNVVWDTMLDADGNLWVGTDHGPALARINDEYDFVPVENYGMTDGLDVSSVVCLDNGHVFAAGMNGILDYSPVGKSSVLKSDSGSGDRRLAHNKVRSLYYDGKSVWAASDGGLDCISGTKVIHYNIKESSGKYLSDWMYAVSEDDRGRLWTGAYDGGLFVVSKSRLSSLGGDVVCDRHISETSGLSGNVVLKICPFGDKVAVVTDKGVDIVDCSTFAISKLSIPDNKRTLSLASDGTTLWVGTEAGVYVLDGNELKPISGRTISAQSMICSEGSLWLCDDSEIWKCDTGNPEWRLVRKFENSLLSIAANGEYIYAGSVNGFYVMPKSVRPVESHLDRIEITALYLDNVLVSPGKTYGGRRILEQDVALTDKIALRKNQNSFALTFSSMNFLSKSGRFAYRLAGFHDEWQICSADTKAVFLNVPPGKYAFEVCHLNPAGNPDSETKVLGVKIMRPWYSTWHACLIYIVLCFGLLRFVLYFREVMHQLQVERAEKEKAQSIANSTISRTQEFRETLSVIFGSRQLGSKDGEAGDGEDSGTPDSKFMKEIVEIVNRHLDDPEFSATALCEESHWPAKQIYRKIKQLTGLSTVEFIRDIRLQKAASLLEQGKLSVSEIMYMSGFTTASYFAKCFKARYGVSPSEYQRGKNS